MATVIFEYAAKFICGVQGDRDDLRLARGLYATEVNIHNPNDFLVRISKKKLALTYPPGEQRPGEVLNLEPHGLKPDTAVAVDCLHVRNKLFGGTKGDEPDPKAPRVDADITTRSLMVRGTAAQVEQIRDLLRKLGETEEEGGLSTSKQHVRLLPLTGSAAR